MISRNAIIIPNERILESAVRSKNGQPTNTNKRVKDSRSLYNEEARSRLMNEIMKARPCIRTEKYEILLKNTMIQITFSLLLFEL